MLIINTKLFTGYLHKIFFGYKLEKDKYYLRDRRGFTTMYAICTYNH